MSRDDYRPRKIDDNHPERIDLVERQGPSEVRQGRRSTREIEAETRFSREAGARVRPEERTISKNQLAEDSDLTAWKNAVEEGEMLSNIPIYLSKKRLFLQQSQAGVQFVEGREKTLSQWNIKIRTILSQLGTTLEPWTRAVKQIEGSYGTGVGSYFRLLRTFLYFNIFVSLITFIFLILPVVTDPVAMEGGGASDCGGADIFLGTGCFEQSILFYGGNVYKSKNVSGPYWKNFSVAKGYIYVTFIGYAVYLIFTMASFVQSYKASFIDNAEMEAAKFGTTVFSIWQMTIEDKDSARELKNKIQEDLHSLLKFKRENKKMSRESLAVRSIVFVLVLIMMAAICYGFYELLKWSDQAANNYVLPIILSFTIVLLPWLLKLLNKVEKYKPTENLYVRMIQTSILILSLLLLIRVYWYQNQTEDECWETKFGQEMYRLVLFFFLIVIGSNLLIETVWSFFGSPEFDISRNSINIIYCQLLTGFGYFYCPLLPWMTTIILVITFYLQYYISLRHNCASSKKTWTSAKTRTLYMIISFVYMLFPSFIFVFFISLYEVTSVCGPFDVGRPPIYVTGIITEDRQVSFWLFNSPVWAGITVGSIVMYYYVWTLLAQQRRLKKFLLFELKESRKELKILLQSKELRKILND